MIGSDASGSNPSQQPGIFRTILVPLDGSPQSSIALLPARTLAGLVGARVFLVRVVPGSEFGAGSSINENEALTWLRRTRDELGASGLHVEVQLRHGDIAEQVGKAAQELGANLVVMASHGRHGLARAILGSVSTQVVTHGTTPVVLLRPGGKRMTQVQTLLVPVDGSPGGSLALGFATGLARGAGARLILLDVAPQIPEYAYASPGGLYIDPSWDEDALAAARTYVDALSARLYRHGFQVESRTALGDAAASILQAARDVDADLIVMSTHARTGLARAVLGSVADAVARGADRPVMVIPHHAAQAIGEPPPA